MVEGGVPLHVAEFLDAFRAIKLLGCRWVIVYNKDGSRELYHRSRLGRIMHTKYSKQDPFPLTETTDFVTFGEMKAYVYEQYVNAELIDDSDKEVRK